VSARVARATILLTLVAVVGDVTVTAQYRPLLSEDAVAVHGFPFVNLAVLGSAVLGALILTKDPRQPIGLLLILIGVTSALSLLAEAYGVWVMSENGPGPRTLGGFSGWISTLLGGQFAIGGLALMFLLAPDGRLLSRRWRSAMVVTVLGQLMCVVALLSENPATYDILAVSDRTGPFASLFFTLGFLLISIGLLASLASILVRLHRSRGETRQQVRLIAVSAALLSAGLATLFVVQVFNGGQQTWAAALPLFLSYMCLPALFAVAVLRYRLYDVEVIVNRTLVLVLGTTFAAVGYTTLVVAAGTLVDSRTSGLWVSLLATALVAVAFQPLRRRVILIANRLAYGSRAQPYQALSDFSRRIAEMPSPESLLPAVADAAARAVSARGAAAALHTPGAPAVSASWGRCGTDDAHTVSVRHGSAELGSIHVWLPPGAQLRPSDVRLLEALADQTAVVFRNVALKAQLASRVAELDRTTKDLAQSRRRIIEADHLARRTMEAAISRDVLPHLVTVPDGVAQARTAVAAAPSERALSKTGLDELVTATNTALKALQELTRGVFPTQLARAGLAPALRTFLTRKGLADRLHLDDALAARRFAGPAEAAVFTCTTEAVREFSTVTSIDVAIEADDVVVLAVGTRRDDGDLRGVRDRAEAVGGSVTTSGQDLTVRIPAAVDRSAALADRGGPQR
jgi:hypothetical protein